LDQQFVSIG